MIAVTTPSLTHIDNAMDEIRNGEVTRDNGTVIRCTQHAND